MPRVTPQDVQAIVDTPRDVMPFILAATALVDGYLSGAGYPLAQLTEIERWWTAHLVACADPQVLKTQLGDASWQKSSPKLGEGLAGTAYGQQVLLLDTKGVITAVAAVTAGDVKIAWLTVD